MAKKKKSKKKTASKKKTDKKKTVKKKKVAGNTNLLDRKIFFYQPDSDSLDIDIHSILSRANNNTSVPLKGDEILKGSYGEISEHKCLRLRKVRLNGFPTVDLNNQEEELDLDEEAGLSEATHFVFFESGIIGVEYNHFGPRYSNITRFVSELAPELIPYVIIPILTQNASRKVRQGGELKSFTIRCAKNAIEARDTARNSIAAAMRSASEHLDAEVEITVRRSKGNSITSKIGDVLGMLSHDVKKLKADTTEFGEVNLLEDKFLHNTTTTRTSSRGRAVVKEDIVNKIAAAYNENKQELDAQLGY